MCDGDDVNVIIVDDPQSTNELEYTIFDNNSQRSDIVCLYIAR